MITKEVGWFWRRRPWAMWHGPSSSKPVPIAHDLSQHAMVRGSQQSKAEEDPVEDGCGWMGNDPQQVGQNAEEEGGHSRWFRRAA